MDRIENDFEISLRSIQSLSRRMNRGILLLLVISGGIRVETESRYYSLKEKDVLLINGNELFEVQGSPSNAILVLTITDRFMDSFYPEYRKSRFSCYSTEIDMGREELISQIRKIMIDMMVTYNRQDEGYQMEMQHLLSEISLIRRFKERGHAVPKTDMEDERLSKIIGYLERNYRQDITLEDTAQKFYLSAGYLSRYFKRKTGMGFTRFLMRLRLRHSLKDLLYTGDTISQISLNNGFANAKSFGTLFKEVYGETPHQYRETHARETLDSFTTYGKKDMEKLIHSGEVLEKLGTILSSRDSGYAGTETRFEKIQIHAGKEQGRVVPHPELILIIGEMKEILREDIRREALTAAEKTNAKYIGVRNLLGGSTLRAEIETDEAIATSSPYTLADEALGFMKKHGLSLFLRIDYREILEDETAMFQKLQEFLRHAIQVYGLSYVAQWKVFFYEPYGSGATPSEVSRIYHKLYDIWKYYSPETEVGMYLPFSDREGVSPSHAWVLADKDHLDFIAYDSNQNDQIDFGELSNDRFLKTKDYLKERTRAIHAILKKHQIEKPMHLITWNTLSGNTRFTNGTFFRAALVLRSVLEIAGGVSSLALWMNTELHEKAVKGRNIRIEGMELFHDFGGRRPAFFAMNFASRLSGSLVDAGEGYVMTKNERGYQLILMNCTTINPYFSVKDAFLSKLNEEVYVCIDGIEEGEYQIRKHTFDQEHGALYAKWNLLNSRHGLDEEMIDAINRESYPSLEVFDEVIQGTWSFYSYLTMNAIHFFDIRKGVQPIL